MNFSKIGSIEAIAFIVIIILNNIVLNLPKSILKSCGSSSILNVIYIAILVIIFLFIVFKLFKNFNNSDILDISNYLGGKWLQSVVGTLFIVFFIIVSSTLVRNFCEILKLTYFNTLSSTFFIVCFLLVAVITNRYGGNTVIKCNLIVFPLSLISLLVTFFCTAPRFVPERIFPIFGYGINETFFSGITNIFSFCGISYIYFLKPLLKNQKQFNKIGYIGIGISAVYLLLSIGSLLLSLPDVLVINELSPMYLLVRAAESGRFFQRPDAIFIFIWTLSLMAYLSTIIFIITLIFKKISKTENVKPMIYCFASLIFVVAQIPANMSEIRFFEDVLLKYFTILLIFIISFIVLLLANLKYKKINGFTSYSNTMKGEIANE